MKIQSFLLFLALLSTIQFCQSKENPFEKFKNQHIIDDMKEGCDKIIQERKIQDKDSNCKQKNTFILHSVKNVIPVCKSGKNIKDNIYKSSGTFRTVLCTLTGDKTSKPCKYKSTEKEEQIVIACEGGEPVHFEDPNKYSNILVN